MITNYLSPTGFEVSINRLPNVEFFVNKINIPGIGTGALEQPTPLNNVFEPRQKIDYQALNLDFIVDENMTNYLEIFNWIKDLANEQSFVSYRELASIVPPGTTSDISILVQNSHKNPNMNFTFVNCFPIDISAIQLDATASDVVYPECTVTFRYDYYDISKVY